MRSLPPVARRQGGATLMEFVIVFPLAAVFVLGLVQGKELPECLVYAAAAGTATTLHQGTALCQRDDFERLIPQVVLTDLSPRD